MPSAFVLPRLSGRLIALALTVAAALAAPPPASAQQEPEFFEKPFAPGQWNIGRRLDQSEFRYCVDPRDPEWEVDGAIADAVAQALLLEPKRYVVKSPIEMENITKLYETMLKNCDAYMGFKLIPEGYPEWVTLSRPYLETQYDFVTDKPDLKSLADLPPGRPIGATIGTMAHIRLVSYLIALPAEKRWPAYPMGSNELSLKALLDGTVDVALVWAPSFWSDKRNDPAYANVHAIAPDPLPATKLGVGMLMLSKETFLRTAVDEAIAALVADGTIAGILKQYDFPATAKP